MPNVSQSIISKMKLRYYCFNLILCFLFFSLWYNIISFLNFISLLLALWRQIWIRKSWLLGIARSMRSIQTGTSGIPHSAYHLKIIIFLLLYILPHYISFNFHLQELHFHYSDMESELLLFSAKESIASLRASLCQPADVGCANIAISTTPVNSPLFQAKE